MDLSMYFLSPLEQLIQEIYLSNHLLNHWDLTIDNLATVFNVEVAYSKLPTFSDNEQRVIFLCHNDEPSKQRRGFFHELGHVIRHSGDQRIMPELFQQMQEADAERFSLYASMPFFMLKKLSLPPSEEHASGRISDIFQVSPIFAQQRLRQIQERISGAQFIFKYSYSDSNIPEKAMFDYVSSSPPVIKGLYGLDDLSRPHTLVIEQRSGFDWEKPLYVEMEGAIKGADPYSYSFRDGAVVSSGDLSARKNAVLIDMGRVASRYGRSANRLYLPIEAVDDALNF
ncbi:hypothetical protein D3C81_820360 [compost metagenome]